MPLKILTNTVWYNAARVFVADGSHNPTAEQTYIENITGGHNHNYWVSSDTAGKYIVYANKTNDNLTCSHVVLTRADLHLTRDIQIRRFPTFPSSEATAWTASGNFAPGFIGVNTTTWVQEVSCTNQEAIALLMNSTYSKTINKLYFSNAFTLSYPGSVKYAPFPLNSKIVLNKQAYMVTGRWQFRADNLTRAEIEDLEMWPYLKTEPFFIYDADGTLIKYKVIHCLLESLQISARQDDIYEIIFSAFELKEWLY